MSAEEEEALIPEFQTTPGFQLPPTSLTNNYFALPPGPTIPASEPVYFNPSNVFSVYSHGKENVTPTRYFLKPNQYALIPGKCGNVTWGSTKLHYKKFFTPTKKIKLFNSSTKQSNVANIVLETESTPITITTYKNKNLIPLGLRREEGKYNFYYPQSKNTNKGAAVSLPPLEIMLIFNDYNEDTNEVKIQISGVLRQSQPYKMGGGLFSKDTYEETVPYTHRASRVYFGSFSNPVSDDIYTYGMLKFKPSENDIKIAKNVVEVIKKALGGSILTYENIIAMTMLFYHGDDDENENSESIQGANVFKRGDIKRLINMPMNEIMARAQMDRPVKTGRALKSYNSLTLDKLLHFYVPIKFIYNFLDSKTTGPYLVIFTACRDTKVSESAIQRRRAYSENRSIFVPGGGAAEVEAAGGGGGGGSYFPPPRASSAGGTRRRRRFHQKRRTKRRSYK